MLNDVTFGQYYPAQSFVHKLDPRLKLLFLIAYIVMLFVANSFYGLALCVLILIVAIIAARVPVTQVLRSVKGVIFILVFTSLLNIFFHGGTEENLLCGGGIIHIYIEGIIFAVFLTIRLFLIVMA
ncbi:MAG: energy-coupling factor transporter transmembrane protein EcfT, partial [Clostridia bacterium]|nr:energy-coupling factor transporter transmembrane protein EcfT [Clostridia bacterium]